MHVADSPPAAGQNKAYIHPVYFIQAVQIPAQGVRQTFIKHGDIGCDVTQDMITGNQNSAARFIKTHVPRRVSGGFHADKAVTKRIPAFFLVKSGIYEQIPFPSLDQVGI